VGEKEELDAMIPLVNQVLRHTTARVFRGVTDTPGKIVSVFEPTTEIIRKGKVNKPTEFGKLVKSRQRPADSTVPREAVQLHQQRLGRAPELLVGDAGFYSAENEREAHALGGEAGLHPESFDPERSAAEAAKATLVPQGAEMEDRLPGPDQRAQTAARAQPQQVSGRGRHGTVGRTRGGCRQAHQYGKSFGKPEERTKLYGTWGNGASLGEPKNPEQHPCTLQQAPELLGAGSVAALHNCLAVVSVISTWDIEMPGGDNVAAVFRPRAPMARLGN
jgi:hypothetical protein